MSRRRLVLATLALLVPVLIAGPAGPAAAVPAPASAAETTPVMVVLDASGSMKQADAPGPRIDAAKRAVTALVGALPADSQVGLTVYGTSTGSSAAEKTRGCRDIRELVPVGRLDRAAFGRAVAGLRASGYTPIGESLRAAARALPAEGPRSIVLVSDGEDTCAPPAPCQVAAQLKKAGVELVVHTIGFKVGEAARRQLACIASATGGTYREASSGAALGAVLTSRVKRAIRPYEAVGIPISGGDSPAAAPVIRPGQYLDTYERGGARLGADGTVKFYAVELSPGETPYFTATLAPPGIRVETLTALAIGLQLVDAEEDSCGLPTTAADVGVYGKVVPQTALLDPGPVGGPRWDEDCASRAFLKVTRSSDAFASQALPVEIAFRLEPAVSSPGASAADERSADLAPPAAGPAQPVEAGSSFNDAPLLEPGTYADSITTGETRYYRMRLDWGQRLAWRATISPPAGIGAAAAILRVDLASPLRADLRQASNGNDGVVLSASQEQDAHGSTLAPVRYANRESSVTDIEPYSVDGEYFLVVDVSYPTGGAAPFAVPVQLTVQRSGAAEAGPQYRTDPAATGPSAGASDSASPSTAAPVAGSAPTRRVSAGAWLWAGSGGLVLVLLAAGTLLLLRRGGSGAGPGGAGPGSAGWGAGTSGPGGAGPG
jgi:Ca-activated chloride channel family protein